MLAKFLASYHYYFDAKHPFADVVKWRQVFYTTLKKFREDTGAMDWEIELFVTWYFLYFVFVGDKPDHTISTLASIKEYYPLFSQWLEDNADRLKVAGLPEVCITVRNEVLQAREGIG